VEVGQLLVVLDTVQIASDVRQARFRLNETEARLEGAGTLLDQNEEEFERQQRLFDQKLTSEIVFKNARYAYLSSKSSYDATLASTKQLQAAFDKQLDYLDKATIVAPMAGVITFLDVEAGEIAAAQTAFTQGRTLMTISDLNLFEVEVDVDETEINKIELGQVADIEVDAFPDTTFAGEVVEIGNTAIMASYGSQDQTTNFKVNVTFADADLQLRPGMSATVDITTAKREDAMAVPFSAVVVRAYDLDSLDAARRAEESGGSGVPEVQAAEGSEEDIDTSSKDEDEENEDLKGVFVIRDDIARFVPIETGIADQKSVEITTGIEEGDTVISGPYRILRNVRDGDPVEIIQEKDSEEDN